LETIALYFSNLSVSQLYEILKLRQDIFVVEQQCIYMDTDDLDQDAWHVMLWDDDKLVSYARVFMRDKEFKMAQIGRVVTDRRYRRQNHAFKVMQKAIEIAKDIYQAQQIYLEAQTYAISFYEKLGFKVTSEEFLEDGIPHVKMILV
jgi:ElaA protein